VIEQQEAALIKLKQPIERLAQLLLEIAREADIADRGAAVTAAPFPLRRMHKPGCDSKGEWLQGAVDLLRVIRACLSCHHEVEVQDLLRQLVQEKEAWQQGQSAGPAQPEQGTQQQQQQQQQQLSRDTPRLVSGCFLVFWSKIWCELQVVQFGVFMI
jgi:hypothetical protein